jgi:hypothetical protein
MTNCITVNQAGTYSVTVTSADGCSSVCSKIVKVNPNPICTITGGDLLCEPGQSTQLCVPAGAASYLWNTGATTNCITVNQAGTYSVTVTSADGCSSVCSKIVKVNPNPICTITGGDLLCEPGQSTQLCVPAGAASYLWNTGATTNCITVNQAGTYSVTVTSVDGCSSVCSKTVSIRPPLDCEIIGNDTICEGQPILLCVPINCETECGTYLWSTGATTNCIIVSTPGTYSVTVTTAGGCISTCSKTIIATPLPVCNITSNDFICEEGQSTQLCVPAGAASYLWSTGDTTNCITVNASGTYAVTVTNANGCSSVCSKNILISPALACDIIGDSVICEGQPTLLCALSDCATYLWSTGATTSCIIINTAGTYSVTVTNASGCTSVCSKTVTVSSQPVCTITGDDVLCEPGQSTQLCVPAGAMAYLWSTGATTNCISVNQAGTYSVTITNAGGCSSICTKTVTVSSPLVGAIIGDTINCLGDTISLCINNTYAAYRWSTGATNACIRVNLPGTYSVTLTSANGCEVVDTIVITQPLAPTCLITLLSANSAKVVATGGTQPYTYKWSTGATTAIVTNLPVGIHRVTVTDANGCATSCEIEIKGEICINLTDAGTIGYDQYLCGPGADPAPLVEIIPPTGGTGVIEYMWMKSTVGGPFNNIHWQPIEGAYSKGYDPGPIFETTYFIRCTRRAECPFIETNYVKIVVGNDVVAKIEGPSLVCTNTPVTFRSTHPGSSSQFTWDFGPAATPRYATGAAPRITFSSFGVFEIKLSITQGNCTSTAVKRINVTSLCSGLTIQVNPIDNEKAQVEWAVQEDGEIYQFVIEHSDNGKDFYQIGQVMTPMRTNGDMRQYEYMDVVPKRGWNYYRVMAVDRSGMQIYSEVEELVLYASSELVHLYPNPVNDMLVVEFFNTLNDEIQMQVINTRGITMQTVNAPANVKRQEINFSSLPAGTYFIKVRYGTIDVKVLKVVKQ